MAEPTAAAMLANKPRLIMSFQVADTGGYPVIGNWRYIDADFAHAVMSGQVKVPGMTPAQILHAIYLHEMIERILLDADNDVDNYLSAHEFATLFEHTYVRSLGVSPKVYEEGIRKLIEFNEKKDLTNPPKDLDCAPYIDDPDADDKMVLKILQGMGVPDASKKSKEVMKYTKSTSNDKCIGCTNWQGSRGATDLSPCAIVSGAVRFDRVCSAFSKLEDQNKDNTNNGETEGGNPQQNTDLGVRSAGGTQVPNTGQLSRGSSEGAGDTASQGGQPVSSFSSQDQGQGQP